MSFDVVFAYAPAVLTFAYVVAFMYDGFESSFTQTTSQFVRRRTAYLILNFVGIVTFVGRAIEIICTREVADNVLFYTLSQVLLQTTIFLTLLASSKPTPAPYTIVWSFTLLVEIALLLAHMLDGYDSDKAQLSLLMVNIGLFVLLIAGAISSWWSDSLSIHNAAQESLLGKQYSHSDASSLTADSYTSLDDDENETMTDFSDDSEEDEEAIKARRAEKLQSRGLLSYCASYKILVPYIIPSGNVRLQLYMVWVVVNVLLERGFNMLGPYLMGRIIDKLTRTHEFPVMDIIVCIVVLGIPFDSWGLPGLNDVLLERVKAWSRQTLVVAAFDRIMSLSADFHDSKDSGEVIKAVEQAESLSGLFHTAVAEVIPGILDFFIATCYMSYLLDAYATLIVVSVGIAFSFSTIFAARNVNTSRRTLAATERAESEILYESIGNWSIVSYFNRKPFEITRLSKAANAVRTADVRSNDCIMLMFAAQEGSERLGLIAILLLAAYRISTGASTVGSFVSVERYWTIIAQPLYTLGHTYRESASHLIDAERILQLFESEIKVQDRPDARTLQLEEGKIEFASVDFAYEKSRTVIRNLSFTVNPGQTVALVGSTGGGKSTITKLLMRLYDINGGQILLDDQDISTVTQDSLRNCFGFVPQDNVLFNTTVLNNVRYGRLDATDEEVYAACKAACIHDRIMSLPMGYSTRVGERGIKMSGGERQRIAIARVLLKTPWIVVLDEATSAMDSQTESEIQKALRNLTNGRTSIIIAHRLSTIVDADVIFVVDQGQIVERGTHGELLQCRGRYYRLWEKQIASQGKLDNGVSFPLEIDEL